MVNFSSLEMELKIAQQLAIDRPLSMSLKKLFLLLPNLFLRMRELKKTADMEPKESFNFARPVSEYVTKESPTYKVLVRKKMRTGLSLMTTGASRKVSVLSIAVR